jgi:hypothetical protein
MIREDALEVFSAVKERSEHFKECGCRFPLWTITERDEEGIDIAIELLKTEPKHEKWVPCSERLPKNEGWVIVTILDEYGDTPYRYTGFGWYLEVANCWIIDAEQRTDVTAWMPLPEPYKGGDTE